MKETKTFTEGKILKPLVLFALPVLLALFLQAMYGAVDLLVVGKFASSVDVSAVSTGSQLMATITNLISSFAMGTTILLGQQIGSGKRKEGGETIGTAMVLFGIIALTMTVLILIFAPQLCRIMNAPEEAFNKTVAYVRICGGGTLIIVAYNLIGCIFRGLGDSNTPLITVAIACVFNIFGDLFFCAVLGMGTVGAAIATVMAQAVSVAASWFLIRRKDLPFIILAIVNSMGVTASAGVGVAEKVCSFIMLISSAFMQSMSAFVAQNYGAGRMDRAKKALHYGVALSFAIGVVMFYISFYHGIVLAGIFSSDPAVVTAGADYLKAYAIDCLLTAIFFCYVGFYNGIGLTKFVMVQGIVGAFFVRVPVSFIMSRQAGASLFRIGLATPMSSAVQTILCLLCMVYIRKKEK